MTKTKHTFAPNAVELPQDPKLYKSGIAYRADMSDEFVATGYKDDEFVDSARLNQYLQYLCSLVVELFKYGVPTPNIQSLVPPQDGDLALFEENEQLILRVYEDNEWKNWIVPAAGENEPGVIFKRDCFQSNRPWDLIPNGASHEDYGPSIKDDYVNKEDLNKRGYVCIVETQEYRLIEDTNTKHLLFLTDGMTITPQNLKNTVFICCPTGCRVNLSGVEIPVQERNMYLLPEPNRSPTICSAVEE